MVHEAVDEGGDGDRAGVAGAETGMYYEFHRVLEEMGDMAPAMLLLENNERGEIPADSGGRTGVQGIFAAGDATGMQNKQIVIALDSGAKAAIATAGYVVGLR